MGRGDCRSDGIGVLLRAALFAALYAASPSAAVAGEFMFMPTAAVVHGTGSSDDPTLEKRQILADYFSIVAFGYGLYGADAAACAYFGRHLDRLDLAQDALLAGMPQAPAAYDPRVHPGATRARRSVVLRAMVDGGYITRSEARAAGAAPVITAPLPAGC